MPLAHQKPGKVRAADDLASRELLQLFHRDGESRPRKPVDHAEVPRVPVRPHLREGRLQAVSRAGRAQAEEVELSRLARDLDLHARQKPKARSRRGRRGPSRCPPACRGPSARARRAPPRARARPASRACRSRPMRWSGYGGRSFDTSIPHCIVSFHGCGLPCAARGGWGARAAAGQVDHSPGPHARGARLGRRAASALRSRPATACRLGAASRLSAVPSSAPTASSSRAGSGSAASASRARPSTRRTPVPRRACSSGLIAGLPLFAVLSGDASLEAGPWPA